MNLENMPEFHIKKYKVKALSIGGRGNRIFNHGEIVKQTDFQHGHAESLVASGHLMPLYQSEEFPKQDKLRLVIGTMIWKRFDVFQFWCDHIKRLQNECQEIEIIAIAVGSEGESSRKIAEKNGVYYTECQNLPLSRKANARLMFAKQFNPDYIMFLGSDDIISTSLLKTYFHFMQQGIDIIEINDLYYFDIKTKSAAYCDGYSFGRRKGEPMAVARCIKNVVAIVFNWQLWNEKTKSSPDSNIFKMISQYNFSRKRITINGQHLVLDIKGGGINNFNINKQNWHSINNQEFLKFISIEEFQKLNELCI